MSEYKKSIMLLFRASLLKGFLGLVSKIKLRFHPILKQIKKVRYRVRHESIANILQRQVCNLGWLNVQNYIFTKLITIFSSHGDFSCFRKLWHVKLQSIRGYWRKIWKPWALTIFTEISVENVHQMVLVFILAPKTGTGLTCTIYKIPVKFSPSLSMRPGTS